MQSSLFTSFSIGNHIIKNRFVRSATAERGGDKLGFVAQELVDLLEVLAKNDVAMIVTGHLFINDTARAHPYQTGIDKDDKLKGLNLLTKSIHQYETKVIAQISHAGMQTKSKYINSQVPCVPSIPQDMSASTLHMLSSEEIYILIEQFVDAIVRAQEANFDGVQLHVAHGYLLNQFLSQYSNIREDEFGGDLEKRFTVIQKIINGAREKVGEDFLIFVKMNTEDFIEKGITLEDSIQIASMLTTISVNAIETSGGFSPFSADKIIRKNINTQEDEAYFLDNAKQISNNIETPIILVGGLRSKHIMEQCLEQGVEMISLSRPLICEPDFVHKLKTNSSLKSKCISCNKCFNPRFMPVRCVLNNL